MKHIGVALTAAILACGLQLAAQECQPGSLGAAARAVSTYRGKIYDFCVTTETIDQTPSWLEDEESPGLSPRGAVRSAEAELSALVPYPEHWTMTGIQLIPAGSQNKWVYVVSFSGPLPSAYGGAVPEFRVLVLLDGKAVTPRVSLLATDH